MRSVSFRPKPCRKWPTAKRSSKARRRRRRRDHRDRGERRRARSGPLRPARSRRSGIPCSISETFLAAKSNQSLERKLSVLREESRSGERSRARGGRIYLDGVRQSLRRPWSEEGVAECCGKRIAAFGVPSVSLADTVGAADASADRVSPERSVLEANAARQKSASICTAPAPARSAKILAAYDAGCGVSTRRMGGLGGCPLPRMNWSEICPTEEVIPRACGARRRYDLDGQIAIISRRTMELSLSFPCGTWSGLVD